jgi:hypothetical protein
VNRAKVQIINRNGTREREVLGEGITDDSGRFAFDVVDPRVETVEVVVSASREEPAQYVEFATGHMVQMSEGERLTALVSDWGTGTLHVTVSPWTHVAAGLSWGLLETKYKGDPIEFDTAIDDAHGLIESHLNRDGGPLIRLTQVSPADVTRAEAATTFNAQVRYGLAIAGLSQLAAEHAAASGTSNATINTLTLTAALHEDLRHGDTAAPLLDGKGKDAEVTNGQVKGSSQWTRADLGRSLATFVQSERNQSPLAALEMARWVDALAGDTNPALYPAGEKPVPYGVVSPPVIQLAAAEHRGTVVSEERLMAGILGQANGWTQGAGEVSFTGDEVPTPVADGAIFSKYTTRYMRALDPNLPEWRWFITDSDPGIQSVQYRVHRGRQLLVDWTELPAINGEGFNYALRLSGEVHQDIGTRSGDYTVTVQAFDAYRNRSEMAVSWRQTVLAPPVAISAGPDMPVATRDPSRAVLARNFGWVTRTDDLMVASWRVDNPNDVPVVLDGLRADVDATWEATTEVLSGSRPMDPPVPARGCRFQVPTTGECLESLPSPARVEPGTVAIWNGEFEMYDLSRNRVEDFVVPPHESRVVVALSGPWMFFATGGYSENVFWEASRPTYPGLQTSRLLVDVYACEDRATCRTYWWIDQVLKRVKVDVHAELAVKVKLVGEAPELAGGMQQAVVGRGASLHSAVTQ